MPIPTRALHANAVAADLGALVARYLDDDDPELAAYALDAQIWLLAQAYDTLTKETNR